METLNVVDRPRGMLFRLKKEGDADTGYNMDDPGGRDAKSQKDKHCAIPYTMYLE